MNIQMNELHGINIPNTKNKVNNLSFGFYFYFIYVLMFQIKLSL